MTNIGWRVRQLPFAIRDGLLFLRRWTSGWSVGVLTAILANILTTEQLLKKDASEALLRTIKAIFVERPPVFFLFAAALLALILSWPGGYLLSKYCRKRRWDYYFSKLLARHADPSIAPFAIGTIVLGKNVSLQLCPNLAGWRADEVRIEIAKGRLRLGSSDQQLYGAFCRENATQDFVKNDNRVYGLAKNPGSFTDSPTLTLQVRECLYSETRFVNEVLAQDTRASSAIIEKVTTDLAFVPNKLAAHIVVVTEDKLLLATLASRKKGYAVVHDTWSFSIEEGLIESDIKGQRKDQLLRWMRRALQEELGIEEDECAKEDVRLLAVFLEGHNLNSGVVAIVHLRLNSLELRRRLGSVPRPDTEAIKIEFFTFDAAIRMLASPTLRLHPTSSYRLFLALCYLLNPAELGRRLQSIM